MFAYRASGSCGTTVIVQVTLSPGAAQDLCAVLDAAWTDLHLGLCVYWLPPGDPEYDPEYRCSCGVPRVLYGLGMLLGVSGPAELRDAAGEPAARA